MYQALRLNEVWLYTHTLLGVLFTDFLISKYQAAYEIPGPELML